MTKPSLSKAARALGSAGGKASAAALTPEQRAARARAAGKAASARLTPAERSARGRAAVMARWGRRQLVTVDILHPVDKEHT